MDRFVFFIFCVVFLYGCGAAQKADERTSSSTNEPYQTKDPTIYKGDINLKKLSNSKNITFDGKTLFSQDVSSGYTFSLENQPNNISLNSTTGVITLDSQSSAIGLYENIIIKASNGLSELSESFSVALNGDPLREYAWHLENTGQKTFMLIGGTAGMDLNVTDVYLDGITGDGVKVAISDSGVEVKHDDLANNALTGEHRDYSLSAPYTGDPTPTSAHGTAVSGIISAEGWNNFGSLGIAPNSKFAGFQFLDSSQSTSLLIHQATGDFDVFNYSYGDYLFQDTQSDPDYIDHLRHQTIVEDKTFVKAAGNEFLLAVGDVCVSHNANFPFENESPFMIVVGALSADGIKATYSSQGSNLWVSAPGGEGSLKSYEPRILTTDLPTCLKGYSKASSGLENDFEYGHTLNPDCHYTSVMNGTSSATPMVTGVIALLKEANPGLKQRDIKHILATTARRIDPNFDKNDFGKVHPSNLLSGCDPINLPSHEYEQGWVKNAANFYYSNFYGFGLVDAKAAVAAAKVYSFPLGDLVEQNADFNQSKFSSGNVNLTIPDYSASGVSHAINIGSLDNLVVESIQIKVKASHSSSGQLGVELTSPSGTKSILMNINNSFLLLDSNSDGTIDGDSNLDIVLTSHAFYGESSQGNWTIKLIDGAVGHTGTLVSWNINVLGHN